MVKGKKTFVIFNEKKNKEEPSESAETTKSGEGRRSLSIKTGIKHA